VAVDYIDALVIVVYLLGIVLVGYYASKKIKTSADYAVAGRSMKFPVLCGTLIGSLIGAAATMGKAGKAFESGYAVLYASFAFLLGYILMGYLAPRLRAAKIDSMPDVLQRRYGAKMRLVAALVLLLVAIPLVGIQLIACGLIVTQFLPDLGLSFTQVVAISALVIVAYTLLGGLLAVAYTDLLQVGIMLLGIGILLPLTIFLSLEDSESVRQILMSPTEGWLGDLDLGYTLAFFPVFTAMVLIDPSIWQRIAAAERAEDLKPAMFFSAGFFGFWSILVVGLGVVAFNNYPGLADADLAIPQMIIDYMPPVLKGICLAAIIALIMSTGDTMLLICGTTVSWDIVRVLRPQTEDQTLLLINRLVILLVGIFSVLFALIDLPLFELNLLAISIFVAGLFVPIMGALFYSRATTAGAMCATILGTFSVIALEVFRVSLNMTLPVEPILAGLSVSTVTFFLISNLTHCEHSATQPAMLVSYSS